MEEKLELLEQVHHDSSMAAYTIEKLLDKLKDKDNKIKAYAEEILQEYPADYYNYADKFDGVLERNPDEFCNLDEYINR